MTEMTRPTKSPESPKDVTLEADGHSSGLVTETPVTAGVPEAGRHPVDLLADEYAERLRKGESPTIEEYEQRFPEHRVLIRTLFPTIALIERSNEREPVDSRVRRRHLIDRKRIGEFQIVREIGRGGMGIVYEAIQSSLGRRVALKVLSASISESPQYLQRFRREAESAARLHHTNIVPVYGIGEEAGFHFYAMQYIDGIPLADAINTFRHRSTITRDHSSTSTVESIAQAAGHSTYSSLDQLGDRLLPGSFSESPLTAPARTPVYNEAVDAPTVLVTIDPDAEMTKFDRLPPSNRHGKDPSTAFERHFKIRDASSVEPIEPVQVSESATPISIAESVDTCFGFFADNTTSDYFVRIAHLVAQVADALEYAHLHGVLHRDIKPTNLMLDRSGGIWVMDFGLVKISEEKDLTLAGEIVGTIRYMAPEQLEGQADARTDVYGLGLTLFELLTLRPAFSGDETVTLAQRLRNSETPRPRTFNPAIPQDLETIVLKATAREPFARYSSAALLAEDLRRFCDDRPILARRTTHLERLWRWTRRNPALATATMSCVFLTALVAIVASVGWVRVHSALNDVRDAQIRAESNLDAAINAFDGLLGKLKARGLSASPNSDGSWSGPDSLGQGTSDDDVILLSSLLQFYRQFALANSDNARLRRRTADAYRQAGTILIRLGRLPEAEEDFKTAITMLTTVLKTTPDDVETAVKLASVYDEIGELYLRRGNFDLTFESHLEARAVLLELPKSAQSDPSVRAELARATDLFASIDVRSGTDQGPPQFGNPVPDGPRGAGDRRGPPFEGLPHGQPPQNLDERLVRAMPVEFPAADNVGDRLANALEYSAEMYRLLIAEFPDNSDYRYRYAQCLRHQLVHAAGNNEPDVVQRTYHEAIEILTRLRSQYPEDPKYLFELAATLSQARRVETSEQALRALEDAVDYAEQLAESFPEMSEYQLLLGKVRARLAAVEEKIRPLSDAEINLEKSIRTLDQLAHRFPDQGIIQIPLAKTRQQFGDLLRNYIQLSEVPVQRLEQSRLQLEQAIAGFEQYLAKFESSPGSPRMGHFNVETRAGLYESLAKTLNVLHEPEKAEHALDESRRFRRPGTENAGSPEQF